MAEILETVKALKERTGAGLLDCKKALEEAGGDIQRAVEILRVKGAARADKKLTRVAREGTVASYIHFGGGRLGSLVEVDCESDFVARTEEFKHLAQELAMQVAAGAGPRFIRREDVPPEIIEQEKAIYRQQAIEEGKPEKAIEKIVQGRLETFFKENCLLEQPYFRDGKRTVSDLIKEAIARFGENVVIRRFARFEVGRE